MNRRYLLGLFAAFAAAVIGAGWQIASRHGVTTTLGPMELAVLRYAIPACLLGPILFRTPWPANLSWRAVALLVACGGLPFGLLVLAGAQFAPAAHVGVFMAGTMPLFTALVCRFVLDERVQGLQWLGLTLVAIGVFSLGASSLRAGVAGSWRGDLLFMVAAALWAIYTVAFRRSGLNALQGAALVNTGSALFLVVPLAAWGAPLLFTAFLHDVLLQVLWQGVIAGVLGLVTYSVAIARLGAARASLSAALVPPMTAVGAALLLGEELGWVTASTSLLVAIGIAFASAPRASGGPR